MATKKEQKNVIEREDRDEEVFKGREGGPREWEEKEEEGREMNYSKENLDEESGRRITCWGRKKKRRRSKRQR